MLTYLKYLNTFIKNIYKYILLYKISIFYIIQNFLMYYWTYSIYYIIFFNVPFYKYDYQDR